MTKISMLLITALAAFPSTAGADNLYGTPTVEKRGQQVRLTFQTSVPRSALRSNYKMILTPFVCQGTDTLRLAPMTFYGKLRYRRERQEQYLRGNTGWTLPEGSRMAGTSCAYKAEFPYARWMRRLTVGVERQVMGCACDCYDGTDELLADTPVYHAPTPVVKEATPDVRRYVVKEADRRWDFGKRQLKVVFKVSDIVLNPRMADNEATLHAILAAVSEIRSKPEYAFKRIDITGAASPEGPPDFNRKLGAGRARALCDYIIRHTEGLTADNFTLENYREDWEGLRQAVAASGAAYKADVLAVLADPALSSNQRKARLKTIDGGRPYRNMLRTIYPGLRSACYISVYYDVRHDPAADAVNAAVALVRQGRYADALRTLRPYATDARTFNTIGVCHMMMENEPEAIRWLHRAAEAGDATAHENLRQIE